MVVANARACRYVIEAFLRLTFLLVCSVSFAHAATATAVPPWHDDRELASLFRGKSDGKLAVNGVEYDLYEPRKDRPALAQALADAFRWVAMTKAGREALVGRYGGPLDWSGLTFDLGFPAEVAARLRGIEKPEAPVENRQLTVTQSNGVRYVLGPKRYLFLTSPRALTNLSGYTVEDNRTLIFVRPGEFTFALLIQTILHEIALTGDQKRLFGQWLYDSEARYANRREPLPKELLQSINGAAQTFAFSVLRAFAFEELVLPEIEALRGEPIRRSQTQRMIGALKNAPAAECPERVKAIFDRMVMLEAMTSTDRDASLATMNRVPDFRCLGPYQAISANEGRMPRIESSACSALAAPLLEKRLLPASGPRPFMRDW